MKFNYLTILVSIFSILNLISLSYAHGELSANEILSNILNEQGVESIDQLDCNEISGHNFEEYGDAIMEEVHPGEAHEIMDNMMGGEGSESLKQMHILMGMRWLGCIDSQTGSASMMPMMGWGNMMRSSYFGYWNFLNVLYTVLLIGLIILVYLWIVKLWKNTKRRERKR